MSNKFIRNSCVMAIFCASQALGQVQSPYPGINIAPCETDGTFQAQVAALLQQIQVPGSGCEKDLSVSHLFDQIAQSGQTVTIECTDELTNDTELGPEGVPSDSTIMFNPNNTNELSAEPVSRTPGSSLVHELYHALLAAQGITLPLFDGPLDPEEGFATRFENYYRLAHGLPLRHFYGPTEPLDPADIPNCCKNETDCGLGGPTQCVDTSQSADNCGSCGVQCRSDQQCVNSTCACPGSQVDCNGVCCASSQCINGMCGCGPGAAVCGSSCCAIGQCTNGVCCGPGTTTCNGTCCGAGQSCVGGVCTTVQTTCVPNTNACPYPQLCCGDQCCGMSAAQQPIACCLCGGVLTCSPLGTSACPVSC